MDSIRALQDRNKNLKVLVGKAQRSRRVSRHQEGHDLLINHYKKEIVSNCAKVLEMSVFQDIVMGR